MRLLLSFAALFMSVALVQLGSGALTPLDALSGAVARFSSPQIGLLGSAHCMGFFAGCWLAPSMTGTIGHVRVFAASGAVGALVQPLRVDLWFRASCPRRWP